MQPNSPHPPTYFYFPSFQASKLPSFRSPSPRLAIYRLLRHCAYLLSRSRPSCQGDTIRWDWRPSLPRLRLQQMQMRLRLHLGLRWYKPPSI